MIENCFSKSLLLYFLSYDFFDIAFQIVQDWLRQSESFCRQSPTSLQLRVFQLHTHISTGILVNRASAAKTLHTGLIPSRVKLRITKFISKAFMPDLQQKRDNDKLILSLVDRWQLDWKHTKVLRCLIIK